MRTISTTLTPVMTRKKWSATKQCYTYTKYQRGLLAELEGKEDALQFNGYDYTLNPSNIEGLYELEWVEPDEEEETEPQWEMDPHVINGSFLSSELSIIDRMLPANRQALEHAIKHISEYKDKNFEPEPVDIPDNDPAQIDYFYEAWENLSLGIRNVKRSLPILKKTYFTNHQTDVDIAYSYVGWLHSNETLIGVEGVPMKWWTYMYNRTPTGEYSQVRGFAPQLGPDSHITLNYGWMKNDPVVSISTGGKTQISQTWEYGLYTSTIAPNSI